MKKILFILKYPPPYNGASIINQTIFDSKLIRGNFQCEYVLTQYSKNNLSLGKKSIFKFLLFLKYYIKILIKLITFNPQLVYFHISSIKSYFIRDSFIVFLLKLFRCKVVLQFHARGVELYSKRAFYHFLYKHTFNNCFAIHLSEALICDIRPYFVPNNIYINPNGVNSVVADKNWLNPKVIKFIFLSNYVKDKGILEVIEAANIIFKSHKNFKIFLVGNETDVTIFELQKKIKELGLENHIFVEGPLHGNDKSNVLSLSDVFIFPTFMQMECFPLVLLEALQFSLPVITTNVGAIGDIIKDKYNGFIVPINNVSKLADSMIRFIDNTSLIKEMGTRNREKYLELYTTENFENRLQNIFNQIL